MDGGGDPFHLSWAMKFQRNATLDQVIVSMFVVGQANSFQENLKKTHTL